MFYLFLSFAHLLDQVEHGMNYQGGAGGGGGGYNKPAYNNNGGGNNYNNNYQQRPNRGGYQGGGGGASNQMWQQQPPQQSGGPNKYYQNNRGNPNMGAVQPNLMQPTGGVVGVVPMVPGQQMQAPSPPTAPGIVSPTPQANPGQVSAPYIPPNSMDRLVDEHVFTRISYQTSRPTPYNMNME